MFSPKYYRYQGNITHDWTPRNSISKNRKRQRPWRGESVLYEYDARVSKNKVINYGITVFCHTIAWLWVQDGMKSHVLMKVLALTKGAEKQLHSDKQLWQLTRLWDYKRKTRALCLEYWEGWLGMVLLRRNMREDQMGKKLENVARWNSVFHKQKTEFYFKKNYVW